MYIEWKGGGFVDPYGYGNESKGNGLHGSARIGKVTFSRTGATLHYNGKSFQSLKGSGFKANYYCVETGEDVREEYWIEIRKRPELKDHRTTSLSTTKRPNATSLTQL
jgi:hypothetical protein